MISLHQIAISNFRSIRGTLTVPLDAEVILIHGPNGAGKTSFMSAMELGLTGRIASLEETSAKYLNHLTHDGAAKASIEIRGVSNGKTEHSTVEVTSGKLSGQCMLGPTDSQYFSERAYLPQARLSRLLEMYQDSDKRGNSLLTEFVNELLGLSRIDSLIEGLSKAGNIRSSRKLVPELARAEREEEQLRNELNELERALAEDTSEYEAIVGKLARLLNDLLPVGTTDEETTSRDEILPRLESEIRAKYEVLMKHRVELDSMIRSSASLSGAGYPQLEAAEAQSRFADEEWRQWSRDHDQLLAQLVVDGSEILMNPVSVGEPDPALVVKNLKARARERMLPDQRQLELHDLRLKEKNTLDRQMVAQEAKIAAIHEEMAVVGRAGNSGEITQLLIEISHHVSSDICPVCGRDYSEVSAFPLSAGLKAAIASSQEQLERFEEISARRGMALSKMQSLKEQSEQVNLQLLSPKSHVKLSSRVNAFKAFLAEVEAFSEAAIVGSQRLATRHSSDRIMQKLKLALQDSLELRSRGLKLAAIYVGPEVTAEGPGDILEAVQSGLQARIAEAEERQAICTRAAEFEKVRDHLASALQRRREALRKLRSQHEALAEQLKLASSRITKAREVLKIATNVRASVVKEVFDDHLNHVWRELFIRLAPSEPFLPRFGHSETTRRAAAELQVIHRVTGSAGPPNALLSAGNLNTAALTLFLSLNLTAEARLPWLFLDDPVQAMDDVHVSQFAALLRTMSSGLGKKTVIAVHERSLFDYLALELSPAKAGERLVTVELSRKRLGNSTAKVETIEWKEEHAIRA